MPTDLQSKIGIGRILTNEANGLGDARGRTWASDPSGGGTFIIQQSMRHRSKVWRVGEIDYINVADFIAHHDPMFMLELYAEVDRLRAELEAERAKPKVVVAGRIETVEM